MSTYREQAAARRAEQDYLASISAIPNEWQRELNEYVNAMASDLKSGFWKSNNEH